MQLEKLASDIEGAIDRAAVAVSDVHKKIVKVPFDLAALITPIADGTHKVHDMHDRVLDVVYDSVRRVNHAVFEGLGSMTHATAPAQPSVVTPADPMPAADPTPTRRKKAVEATVKP